jgi:hypothetical protein
MEYALPVFSASALGIAVEILCEATNKVLQRIARPVGERPKQRFQYFAKKLKINRLCYFFEHKKTLHI